jgi:opacity protein-like surface antigen
MSRTGVTLLALALLAAGPSNAFADATLFAGVNTTPATRLAKGFAVGVGLLVVAFEFEMTSTSDDAKSAAPSLNTGMGNVLLQTPFEIFRVQPYVTFGAGAYRETLEAQNHQETNAAFGTGGGVKIGLIGPVRLRLDYRVFKLTGGALNSPAHRFYAGLNLKF